MADLSSIRSEIDQIDDQIVDLLAKRFSFVKDVVNYKQAHGLPAVLPDRVDEVINRNAARARDKNLNPDLVQQIYRAVIDEYCRLEEKQLHPDS